MENKVKCKEQENCKRRCEFIPVLLKASSVITDKPRSPSVSQFTCVCVCVCVCDVCFVYLPQRELRKTAETFLNS